MSERQYFKIVKNHSYSGEWSVVPVRGALLRDNGPRYYTKERVDISEVRSGDWFAADLDMGPVVANTAHTFKRMIQTTMSSVCAWEPDQTVTIYRPVGGGGDSSTNSLTLDLTVAEAQILKEIFNRYLSGRALVVEGPLNEVFKKVESLKVSRRNRLTNRNVPSDGSILLADYPFTYGNAIAILDYQGETK